MDIDDLESRLMVYLEERAKNARSHTKGTTKAVSASWLAILFSVMAVGSQYHDSPYHVRTRDAQRYLQISFHFLRLSNFLLRYVRPYLSRGPSHANSRQTQLRLNPSDAHDELRAAQRHESRSLVGFAWSDMPARAVAWASPGTGTGWAREPRGAEEGNDTAEAMVCTSRPKQIL